MVSADLGVERTRRCILAGRVSVPCARRPGHRLARRAESDAPRLRLLSQGGRRRALTTLGWHLGQETLPRNRSPRCSRRRLGPRPTPTVNLIASAPLPQPQAGAGRHRDHNLVRIAEPSYGIQEGSCPGRAARHPVPRPAALCRRSCAPAGDPSQGWSGAIGATPDQHCPGHRLACSARPSRPGSGQDGESDRHSQCDWTRPAVSCRG